LETGAKVLPSREQDCRRHRSYRPATTSVFSHVYNYLGHDITTLASPVVNSITRRAG